MRRGFRLDRDLGELEFGPTAGAEGVVEGNDAPAAGALAPRLVAIGAVEREHEQAEHGQDRRDQEAEEHRDALHSGDNRARDPEPRAEHQVDHCG